MENLLTSTTSDGKPREGDRAGAPKNVLACPSCSGDLSESELYHRLRVCDSCGYHFRMSAHQRIDLLIDEGSFRETHRRLASVDPLSFSDKVSYRKRLQEAQRKTGLMEAVVTGLGHIGGKAVAMAVMDFEFLGGSMGSVVGEKIALTFELATKEKLPVIVIATGGGARIQEGMLALMQMAKTASAVQRHNRAGLPYISVLANPTTGGIYASFANLADVIVAEPGALIGFAGPRVVAQTTGKRDDSSHSAEFLFHHGMIDLIVERGRQRTLLALLLRLLDPQYRLAPGQRKEGNYLYTHQQAESAWETVQLARHHNRPTALDYICRITTNFVELHGDRVFGDDPAVTCGLADLGGQPVVVIGQERGHGEASRNEGRAHPEGYRKAQRVMRLAAKLGLPVITFVDTPGADPGLESEERGIAMSLATSLALMSDLQTPIISVVIGEGGSGGALALGLADRVLMLENAIYSVISPEGAAAIIYRDATRAADVASALKLTAHDARALGIVDVVVPEPEGGAHLDHEEAAWILKNVLLQELTAIQAVTLKKLLKRRYRRFRRIGRFGTYFKVAVEQKVAVVQDQIHYSLRHITEKIPHLKNRL